MNNYTNQCLGTIGRQLDRIEDGIDNKVLLQPGNPSKPNPILEKPLVTLPTTRQASLKSKDQTALRFVASAIQVPRTLKWSEISFPADWTLENENYPLQVQNPVRNPELDLVQQLADGTVRLSFDQSRFRSPLEYDVYV